MRVSSPAPNAQIDQDTVFRFEEAAGIASAWYGGGRVAEGLLIGRRRGTQLRFRYLQRTVRGEIASGSSVAEVDVGPDGRWFLVERFRWDDGGEGVNRLDEVPEVDAAARST